MIQPYYQEKNITIYHGDCLEIMPELESVDLVVTSPPFNADKVYEIDNWKTLDEYIQWLSYRFINLYKSCNSGAWVICELQDMHVSPEHSHALPNQKEQFNMGTSAHLIVNMMQNGWYYKGETIWDRGRWINQMAGRMACAPGSPALLVQHSKVLFFRKPGGRKGCYREPGQDNKWLKLWCRTIWNHIQPSYNPQHPAIMPIKMAAGIIQGWSLFDSIILDPFMGIGTTLLAAKKLKHKAIGIEKEKIYCEIAVRRLAQKVMEFKKP